MDKKTIPSSSFEKCRSFLDWIGRWQILQGIFSAKWATGAAMLTAASGYLGDLPLMWILMASALVFMAISVALVQTDYNREIKTPLNKLRYTNTLVNYELVPLNRRTARAKDKLSEQNKGLLRHIDKVQIGVSLRNIANFPISVILENAETKMEGKEPPREKYPKKPTILLPGNTLWISDAAIPMENIPCEKLEGEMKIKIRYGLQGKENFSLDFNGKVEALMQPVGFVTNIYTTWDSEQVSL